jgi:mannose-6-phosphate isomerase-like protein (cupin superfamily)
LTEQAEARGRFGSAVKLRHSVAHIHDYDEYMIVVQGGHTWIIHGERIPVKAVAPRNAGEP